MGDGGNADSAAEKAYTALWKMLMQHFFKKWLTQEVEKCCSLVCKKVDSWGCKNPEPHTATATVPKSLRMLGWHPI